MSVWSKEHNPETSLKRNTFPQSFCNNLTFNFGKIVPFACFETLSGDTFELNTSFGLRFWPTAFPLQSRIRADIHWFYVRKRNLYDEYKEHYTGGTVRKPMPFLANLKSSDFKNGSLMDYFNVPTTINLSDGDKLLTQTNTVFYIPNSSTRYVTASFDGLPISTSHAPVVGVVPDFSYVGASLTPLWSTISSSSIGIPNINDAGAAPIGSFYRLFHFTESLGMPTLRITGLRNWFNSAFNNIKNGKILVCPVYFAEIQYGVDGKTYRFSSPAAGGSFRDVYSEGQFIDSLDYDISDYYKSFIAGAPNADGSEFKVLGLDLCVYVLPLSKESSQFVGGLTAHPFSLVSSGSNSIQLADFFPSRNPFIVTEETFSSASKIPLNALPFRAYEQIYNAFFRDERNNPLVIDGEPYYDKYLRSTAGGADLETYELHTRNWEQDFLTTALPSPQQGEAPLVGISPTGVMTLADENGNTYQAQAITADDNDTIIGAKFIATNQDGTSVPNNVARSLVSYATSGISINDFRNVNALQRYLETNLRRGLKYRDLVAARWGVNISYSEMNMPEFIGGATEYVVPSQVTQTSQDTSDSPLGSYAGQLHCRGAQKHKIRHFCDEDGYIIGLVSVVPTPIYSQLLPKMFTKFDPLDHFQPEFGHIGLQPIPMKEVAPLQVALSNGNQNETFGYQRAWYDYLGRVDEVHGDMRGSLRDYVMYRTFSGIPRLGTDFLLVDNKPLDSVFMVQKDADGNSVDKILGQIYIDAVSRRPIPRYGIPRLE